MEADQPIPSVEDTPINKSRLIYGLNDNPPFAEGLFVAVQHVMAIFVPIVTPPLIICGAIGIDPANTAIILGMSLAISGVATFIQAKQIGPIGTGLLSIQGTSFSFVGPIITVGLAANESGKTTEETLALIFGLCFFGAFVQIILSRFLNIAQKIITPLVTGIVVTLIGTTLIKVGIIDMAGGFAAMGTDAYGSPRNWGISITVLMIIAFLSVNRNRYIRMGSIVLGLIVGYLIALITGMVDFSVLEGLPAINFPIPFRYGLGFDFIYFIPFAIIYIATAIECIGDITATSMVTQEPIRGATYFQRLKAGVLGDGFNSWLASVFNTFPNSTMSQNNGLISITGVGSRYIGYYLAVILIFLGLFPIIGGVLNTIPKPVLGGATILMFGSVAVAGLNILREVEMDSRSSIIVAVSLAFGLGVTFAPDSLEQMPQLIKDVFSSGIATGAIVALLMNLVMPGRTTVE
ncbi:MAG: uracil-xanthine permease family protein [Microcystaceae cyanobacterium]